MRPGLAAMWSLLGLAIAHASACGRVGYEPTPLGSPDASPPGSGGRAAEDATAGAGGTPADGSPGGAPDRAEPGADALDDAATADVASPPRDSSTPPADAPAPEAGTEGGTLACPGAKVWAFDFGSDPTLADTDGDGVFDWVLRNAPAFPVTELSGGVWRSETRIVLDSRPLDDFGSRTVVDVRMRSATVPAAPYGAVFWVNVNQGTPVFSAVFVSLALGPDGTQTLTLFGKPDGNTETAITSVPALPDALVDVHLDIDTAALTTSLVVNGVDHGSHAFPATGTPNADRFATLLAWDGVAEFDSVRVQRCPSP